MGDGINHLPDCFWVKVIAGESNCYAVQPRIFAVLTGSCQAADKHCSGDCVGTDCGAQYAQINWLKDAIHAAESVLFTFASYVCPLPLVEK